jgi:branched-chain amino acid transport system permease protein
MNWQTLPQQLANGIFQGSIYALFALGYTLIFGVLDILNLAHAAIFMMTAVAAWYLIAGLGLNFIVALVLASIVGGLLGVLLDRVAFWRLRQQHAPHLSALISSIAMATIFEGIVVLLPTLGADPDSRIIGADLHHFPAGSIPSGNLNFGTMLSLPPIKLLVLFVALLLMFGLQYMLRRTRLGREMRAVAESPKASALLGINIEAVFAKTFFIASALGGVAGVLYALTYDTLTADMGSAVELKGLAAIILGGMGSIVGSVVGGFIIGLAEVFSIALGGSNWSDAVAFIVLFLMLLVRPSGLFGARATRTG